MDVTAETALLVAVTLGAVFVLAGNVTALTIHWRPCIDQHAPITLDTVSLFCKITGFVICIWAVIIYFAYQII